MTQDTTVIDVFRHCVAAIRDGKLIRRESRQDKKSHFQNWVRARLKPDCITTTDEGVTGGTLPGMG